MAASIVIAVYAAMTKDVRWILIFALPFASFAIWEFVKLNGLKRRRVWTTFGTLLNAILLAVLYQGLAPSREDIANAMPAHALTLPPPLLSDSAGRLKQPGDTPAVQPERAPLRVPGSIRTPTQPASLFDAFQNQLNEYGMMGATIPVDSKGVRINVPVNVYADTNANSKFAAILIPEQADPTATLMGIASNPQALKRLIQNNEAKVWELGEIPDDKEKHMVFTGEVYVYSAGLSIDDMKKVESAFGKAGMKFRPRYYSYLFRHYQAPSANLIGSLTAPHPFPMPPQPPAGMSPQTSP